MLAALITGILSTASIEEPRQHSWLQPEWQDNSQPGRMSYMDGNTFKAQCQNSEVVCIAYLQGVNDAFLETIIGTGRDVPYCIPERSTPQQVYSVVKVWMERNPQHLHNRAPVLIAAALADAWPQCGSLSNR